MWFGGFDILVATLLVMLINSQQSTNLVVLYICLDCCFSSDNTDDLLQSILSVCIIDSVLL